MSIFEFKADSIDGQPADLSVYRGKALLVVNTASQCAYSRQFAGLQKLYEAYRDQGFEILAFPCNQFNGKEPEDNPEVKRVCQDERGVTFPLFAKVDVRGESAHPLFSYMVRQAPFQGFDTATPDGERMDRFVRENYPEVYAGDGVKWNFTKFLIDRSGQVHARYETTVEPSDIEQTVRELLS
jgi:Glutathione peroxidase